jgi:hypothetical protein
MEGDCSTGKAAFKKNCHEIHPNSYPFTPFILAGGGFALVQGQHSCALALE